MNPERGENYFGAPVGADERVSAGMEESSKPGEGVKVVIATPLFPPEPGGPATYASILMELLVREGVEATLVKFSDVRNLPKGIRHLAYAWRVYTSAKKANAVLVLDPVSTGLPALLGAKCAGKPVVVKVVGDYAWEQGAQRYGITSTLDEFVKTRQVPFQVRFLRFVQTCVVKQSKMVIVPSEYLKTIVMAWGIFHGKIMVIHNAIRHEDAGEIPHEVATLPYPHVVSVGRLVPWKHMDGVIDAVATLPSTSLIIVGDGPERGSLTAHAEKTGSRVTFTGALSHADTLAVLGDAQAFVLNSSYEGFSHLLVEAVSLGVPVVATDVGGNGEIVQGAEDGILVPSQDRTALASAIQQALTRKKRTRPEDAIVRFSPKTMVRKTAELLKSLG